MKTGDVVVLRHLAPSLGGVHVRIVEMTLVCVTVELMENGAGESCWRKGDKIVVFPNQLKGEDDG